MFRLIFAVAIIAFIFAHSPERPGSGFGTDAERWVGWTKREMAEAAFRSGAAQDLLRSAAASDAKQARAAH